MAVRPYFDKHLLIVLAAQVAACSSAAAPTLDPGIEGGSDAVVEQTRITGPTDRASGISNGLDSTPRVAATDGDHSEPSASSHPGDEREEAPAHAGAAPTGAATLRAERRVASATARRNSMTYRFLLMEGVDPDLDANGEGDPVPYRRSELQVRDGDAWAVIHASPREPLHDLQCRIPERYTLEVVDEHRPLLLLHGRWRWTRCDPGVSLAGPSFEEGTFVIARDDAGAIRWSQFRTRLVLVERRPIQPSEDGSEAWSPVQRVDERGELRVRRDGHVTYRWDGDTARASSNLGAAQLFGPQADAIWSDDVL